MNPPSPVTSPAPKTPGRASSVAGSTFNQPRSVCANPVARHASTLGRRPVATSNRSAETTAPDFKWTTTAEGWRDDPADCFSTATHGSPIISVMPSASRCGRSAAPASGSSRPRNAGPASITVTLEPRRAKACPSSTPMAPPPRIASDAGSSLGIAAWRLVQNSTVSRPGMGGIAAVLPLAITTARRAMSRSLPTSTVRRSVSLPSPRKSLAPVASSAAAGWLSSRSRAIHSTRLETLGKSTVHSTREAARRRARSASLNVSPERSRVLDGTQPQ